MSLSDLELLELVESAKERQRGPKGEPGNGIASIEQFTDDSFTIKLDDGSFKKIALQPGKDGEVGAPVRRANVARLARQDDQERMVLLVSMVSTVPKAHRV